jgi:hypothetical protein
MSKVLCIFHGGCDDGVAAAWAVRHALGDSRVEFYPGVYQKPPPDVSGRDVVLVDFSYKRPVIDRIIESAKSLLILDHHKTAAADLAGLPPAGVSIHEWSQKLAGAGKPVGVLFDMERSGAGIAWDFFHNLAHDRNYQTERPEFIDYIEDRDLWRKALPGGDQFTIALRSYPQDLQVWDALVARGVPHLIEEGRSIWRYYESRIEEMRKSAYQAEIGFDREDGNAEVFRCLIANAPYFAASELAGAMAEEDGMHDFGACYFEVRPGEWQYSLRSRGNFDVSQLALRFGGGGHAKAAGFTVPDPVHSPSVP